MDKRFFIFMFVFTLGCEEAGQIVGEVIDFVDTISDGAPCEVNEQCLGQYCVKQELDYPNGYCTTLQCEKSGCSGLNSECFATQLNGQSVNACFELCNGDGTCERASEGYVCVSFQDTAVCLPPNATSATAQGETGSACSNNTQCNGENATCLTSFFGGYCSQYECNTDGCLADNPCLSLNPEEPAEDQKFACFRGCTTDDDCRFQFACKAYNGTKVCLEGERTKARNPDGADDGAQCAAQINCKGATCIREQENEEANDVSFPDGYCTTRDCVAATDCNGDALCVTRGRSTTCLAKCATDGDCRKGYACVTTPDGQVCDSVIPQVAPEETDVFEIKCQSSKTTTFEIPQGSEGFYIGPFTRDGSKIIPQTLEEPSGKTLNIPNEYSWFAINPEILGSLSPLAFPGSDQAAFKNRFTGGTYKLTVQTAASEWCYYTIPQAKEGTTLLLNVYLIGIDGVTAGTAASNSNLEQVIANVASIYRKMGIRVEVANYIDAEKSVSDLYSTLRDFNDIYNLVATSTATGTTKEDVLSVNVFLINDFNISEAPGILGISTGIPGMAGLHGSSGSGLVFSAASLGSDNRQLGQTMAHEIGHYLGLRHTTEHSFLGHDPITDTPECIDPNLATLCADSSNFMFAFALGGAQQVVTTGQTYVVRRNPLVQ